MRGNGVEEKRREAAEGRVLVAREDRRMRSSGRQLA